MSKVTWAYRWVSSERDTYTDISIGTMPMLLRCTIVSGYKFFANFEDSGFSRFQIHKGTGYYE